MTVMPEAPGHKTKQLRPKLAQDFAVAQESADSSFPSRKRFHSFDARSGLRRIDVSESADFGLLSAAIRAASASFSARALAAIALTASNSSRGTKSMSATSRSSRCFTKVSISARTPWAMPAASVNILAMPSRNGLSVCAMAISSALWRPAHTAWSRRSLDTMARSTAI